MAEPTCGATCAVHCRADNGRAVVLTVGSGTADATAAWVAVRETFRRAGMVLVEIAGDFRRAVEPMVVRAVDLLPAVALRRYTAPAVGPKEARRRARAAWVGWLVSVVGCGGPGSAGPVRVRGGRSRAVAWAVALRSYARR